MLEKNIVIIIVILCVFYFINQSINRKEGMSLGTAQQMAAIDNQDEALSGSGGSINRSIRSGDFAFRFNQPSKMISGTQRGARASRTNKLQIINDAYTGTYGGMPCFDIAGPIVR
jgi:hypothetical protein